MIIDKTSNLEQYTGTVKHLDQALAYLKNKADLPLGKYEFDGGFIISTEGVSEQVENKSFEVHRRYADVMVILGHDETVCFAPSEGLPVLKPFSEEEDCGLCGNTPDAFCFTIPAGYFYIMLPGEAHKPTVHIHSQKPYRKYIIKCLQQDNQ